MESMVVASHEDNSSARSEENIPSTSSNDQNDHHGSTSSSDISPDMIDMEAKMRRRLQFFFMNPIEKWHAKRKFPYKFVVQVIKIILVTFQLCLFAHSRYVHVNYTWDSRITFSHLFLPNWDPVREINAYPPATGTLAIYKIQDLYDTLNFASNNYANLDTAIGRYSYDDKNNVMPPPMFCFESFKKGEIFGFNDSYVFDSQIVETCSNLTKNLNETEYDVKSILARQNITINFSSLIKAKLKFVLKTVNFKARGPINPPDCYKFNIEILFDNTDNDGQMSMDLEATPFRLTCKDDGLYLSDNRIDLILTSILNILVIIICGTSFVLCCRAVYRAQLLKEITVQFFHRAYNKELSSQGRLEFLNMWYIMIIVNDILIIIGSAIKEQIERKQFVNDQWNICSVFLGTGNLLVWFGVLRYLGFFKTYNVVILTLKKATPKISRFLICALLIYAGFAFCGWLVLGPYHMKFRSLATTSECLFSLINGDDMFPTFAIMSTKSPLLWWYSRVYLYSFVSLYIYVVLSLFISVIMDAYDTIKKYYQDGFPKSDLQSFIGKTTMEELSSGVYRTTSTQSLHGLFTSLFCCNKIYQSPYTKIDGNVDVQESNSACI